MYDSTVTPGPLLSLALARWTVHGPLPMPYGFHTYRAAAPGGAIHLHACVGRFGTVGYDLHSITPGRAWRLCATNPNEDAIAAAAFAAARSSTSSAEPRALSEVLARSGWETETRLRGEVLTELVFTAPAGRTRVHLVTAREVGRLPERYWQITDGRTEDPATADLTTPVGVLTAYLTAATARRS